MIRSTLAPVSEPTAVPKLLAMKREQPELFQRIAAELTPESRAYLEERIARMEREEAERRA